MESFERLLHLSTKRKVSSKQFVHLYKQLANSNPVTSGIFIRLLENPTNEEFLVAVSVTSIDNLKLFWNCIGKLPVHQQASVLKKYQSQLQSLASTGQSPQFKEQLVEVFLEYSDYVLTTNHESLLNELIFNWDILIAKFDIKENESVKNFIVKLLDHFNSNGLTKQFHYCSKFVNNKSNIILQTNLNNLTISRTAKNYTNFENLKIFYYFNRMFRTFDVPSNEALFKSFNQLFNGDCYKLIYCVFNGIHLCEKTKQEETVKNNWMNFLSSRLPKLILLYRVDTLDDIIFRLFENFESLDYTFKQFFVKSLIFNKILSIKSFHKFFPNENRINQQTLIHEMSNVNSNENFKDVLDDKLYNINCEFISVEESGIIEYFDTLSKKIEFSVSKQEDFVQTIERMFELLINELEFEKLNRLVLVLLYNEKLFNSYLFNLSGNYQTVFKLIRIIDSEFKLTDDTSFQDFYSYFGNLLLYIIKWSKYVNLDFKAKNSFTLNYLHNYHLNYSNLSSEFDDSVESDKTIANNYNDLLTEWINALFDESEGLSDDLIKSIDIKQIYQLIPLIYQEAILAFIYGKINLKILQNGLDYLSQNFLLPCNISIVNWLLLKINLNNKNMDNYLIVLNEMVSLIGKVKSESNNVIKLQSEIVLEMITDQSAHSLKNLDVSPTQINNELILNKITPESKSGTNFLKLNFEEFETNLFKAFAGHDSNYELIDYYVNSDALLIRDFLISLNSATVKNNSKENLKYLIDLVLFLEINKSVKNNGNKQYWIKKFSELKPDAIDYNNDQKFEKSIDHHYSSIFNTDNDDDNNENDSESGNNHDDELFESISIDYCVNEMHKYNGDLADFLTLMINYKHSSQNEPFFRYLHLIHKKLLTDLNNFNLD